MSWSLVAVGKAPAVLKEVEKQSAQQKCSEPEESVRQAAVHAVKAALIAQDPSVAVEISASGSQSEDYTTHVVRNHLNITIKPLSGFLE